MRSKVTPKSKPLAVVISDIHYSLSTYKIADIAFRAAIDKAAELDVPLIDCGDLTNDKALLRAEVVNTLLATMKYAQSKEVDVYLIIGNHSLINEKSKEHALNFLIPYAIIIDETRYKSKRFAFIPYQHNPNDFYEAINTFPKGSIVYAHQGTIGGQLGDYIKDSSAIDPLKVKEYRLFLGHYHKHYELENTVSIGNPYTLTFGEAGDGDKGFLIVYEDGSYTREVLNIRRHRILDLNASGLKLVGTLPVLPNDLLWVKLRGTYSELKSFSKAQIGKILGVQSFKLDKIYEDLVELSAPAENRTAEELLDALIDQSNDTDASKTYLKELWRNLLETKAV